jgi:tRNA(Ile2) C34 agmatinyltransferase TiaS
MEYAELALPGTPLKYLSTDNINRTTHNTTVTRNDKIAATIYGHALRGVQPGDINAIERADKRVQSYFAPFVAARGIIGARAARKLQRQVT